MKSYRTLCFPGRILTHLVSDHPHKHGGQELLQREVVDRDHRVAVIRPGYEMRFRHPYWDDEIVFFVGRCGDQTCRELIAWQQ